MEHCFTPKAENVLHNSQTLAGEMGHAYIGSEHLLLSLAGEKESVASRFLLGQGLDADKIKEAIAEFAGVGTPLTLCCADMTPRAKQIISRSGRIAQGKTIGTEHLLAALLQEKEAVAFRLLSSMGLNIAELTEELQTFLEGAALPLTAIGQNYTSPLKPGTQLALYGRDLTQKAAEGGHDPLIGREEELERIVRILCRRQKNNPCLIGEPGVGKTAIVEGLARCIVEGNIPEPLQGKSLILLDLPSMIAGAKYRGEFEDRLKGVIREVSGKDQIILFLDEMHTMVGAGAAEGAVDAANILKPALARGEVRLIGATTVKEYRTHMEKDAALTRRFQPVFIKQPSEEQTLCMLRGLKSRFEAHHRLTVSEEAMKEAVRLSVRYIHDRFLPDKAIDLLDEAASGIQVGKSTLPLSLRQQQKQLDELLSQKLAAIRSQQFERAAHLRDKEKQCRQRLEQEQQAFQARQQRSGETLLPSHIADVVTRQTGIPLKALTESEEEKLLRLESILSARIIGQPEAVGAVCRAIRRGRLGLKDPKRPVGCFLFLGPTGVGKTALCRALAEVLFGTEEALVRLDMSEYMEKHSISRLIGAPPGYIGYDDGGQLTERIRRRPYAVVLFDEIEKAHPDICDLLLQIMEDGVLTDSQGRQVIFSHAVIILTSNIGAAQAKKGNPLGFTAHQEESLRLAHESALKEAFRPEFINRLDEIIAFHPLMPEHLRKIAAPMLEEVTARAAECGVVLKIDTGVTDLLVREGHHPRYDARPLRRTITRMLEDKLSDALLRGEIRQGDQVLVAVHEDALIFLPQSP